MRVLLAALCLFLFAGTLPARAQVTIHRCLSTSGEPVFTDQPCAALQATPALPRPAAGGAPDAGLAPSNLCAADAEDLRRIVADAFAAHDANRLASVMWWDGLGSGAVVADIRALAAVLREPLLQVTVAPDRAAGGRTDDAPPATLALETGGDAAGTRTLRFDVLKRAGCLWLRRVD